MKYQLTRWALLMFVALVTAGCAGTVSDLQGVREEAYKAYEAGDYATATEKFETLIQHVPKDAELWFRLGNSYAKEKLPQDAVAAYENALLRDPKMGKAWYNLGLIHLQTSLKAFVDMQQYVPNDEPAANKGKVMREGIFALLGYPEEKGASKD